MYQLNDNELVWAKVRDDAIIPTKTDENAGYDIYANFAEDEMIIHPHETKMVPTGIAVAVSDNYYLQVQERGSTGSKGIKYSAGVIDSSYRGEIFICITNSTNKTLFITKSNGRATPRECEKEVIMYPYSKAIAQLIVHRVHKMKERVVEYDELLKIPSFRGLGKLGSSGK